MYSYKRKVTLKDNVIAALLVLIMMFTLLAVLTPHQHTYSYRAEQEVPSSGASLEAEDGIVMLEAINRAAYR